MVHQQVRSLEQRFPDGLPRLDPIEDMGIRDDAFLEAVQQLQDKEAELLQHPLFKVSYPSVDFFLAVVSALRHGVFPVLHHRPCPSDKIKEDDKEAERLQHPLFTVSDLFHFLS